MKITYLTKTIVGILFALLLYGCLPNPNPPSNLSTTICMDYSNSQMSTLSVKLVHEMVNGYKSHQLSYIENVMTDDAHSIWFDIETLKKFIYHMEMTAKNNDDSIKSEDLGLRIYYGRYPEKETWGTEYKNDLSGFLGDPLKEQYEERHTLVMVPTIRVNKMDLDFNPRDPQTYTNGFRGQENNPNYGQNSLVQIPILSLSEPSPSNPSGGISAQNHGSLIPPGLQTGEGF